ncbi:Hypothetical predicted protein [Paramuricea clavata]|uniref:Uncharacterized protein n=1 Tax=Paramuricea clavata TaxID=317549 RepID=A0A6S7J5H6_PARCT|nr:Hypothetical predicted protein [Paramuricea clavata]
MEVKNLIRATVVLFLSDCTVRAAIPSFNDFDRAREEIMKRPEIVYDSTFCSEIASGEDKVACRLKDIPSIGFLVCKKAKYDETPCKDIIETELANFLKLRSENINVVTVDKKPVENIRCGATTDQMCSGFLEAWIDQTYGEFGHVRDHIAEGTVGQLVEKIIKFTRKDELQTTTSDLRKIVEYMQPSSKEHNYKQICDLQGFFLIDGGFLINDTPEINENIATKGVCWDGEPTTEQVLSGLKNMIDALNHAMH